MITKRRRLEEERNLFGSDHWDGLADITPPSQAPQTYIGRAREGILQSSARSAVDQVGALVAAYFLAMDTKQCQEVLARTPMSQVTLAQQVLALYALVRPEQAAQLVAQLEASTAINPDSWEYYFEAAKRVDAVIGATAPSNLHRVTVEP